LIVEKLDVGSVVVVVVVVVVIVVSDSFWVIVRYILQGFLNFYFYFYFLYLRVRC